MKPTSKQRTIMKSHLMNHSWLSESVPFYLFPDFSYLIRFIFVSSRISFMYFHSVKDDSANNSERRELKEIN